jgi:hypothetical protein
MKTKEKTKAQIVVRTIDGQEVKIINLAFHAQLKAADDGEMIIEGYASVFGNLDSYYEIVDRGAFVDFLRSNFPRYPKLIWAHNWEEPIGVTLEAREDEHGLFVRGKLTAGVQRAEEAYKLIKDGAITDLSFGFRVDEDEIDQANGARHLKKISIYEWSPVLVGANHEAQITKVKSDGQEQDTSEEVPPETQKEENETPQDTPAGDPEPKIDPPQDPPATEEGEGESTERSQAISDIAAAVDTLSKALEALKAIEHSDPARSEALPKKVDARSDKDQVVKAILRDARKAKGQIETIIVRAKKV